MESVLDIRTVFAVVSVCCVPVSHVDSLQNRTSRNVEIYENFFSSALRGQPADLPNEKGNFFLSPLHGIIPAIFQNAKNGRKKAGNLFLISCSGVSLFRCLSELNGREEMLDYRGGWKLLMDDRQWADRKKEHMFAS